jgi:hypothetical protein
LKSGSNEMESLRRTNQEERWYFQLCILMF